jgi:chemotaxis protein histidine kinase CheA
MAQVADLVRAAEEEVAVVRDNLVQASPIGAAILDQVTVSRADLESLREGVGQLQKRFGGALGPLLEVTSRLASRPFGEATGGLADAASRWAEQRGKRAVAEVDGKEVQVGAALAEVLPGILTHLVRNAVSHGLEAPEERGRLGKPDAGLIRIECNPSASGAVIVVSDDGGGIDLHRVRDRARELGIDGQDPLELLFADGLSTAAMGDDLSGHGVGMSAVRRALRSVQYDIAIDTERDRGTVFTMRPRARLHPSGDLREVG